MNEAYAEDIDFAQEAQAMPQAHKLYGSNWSWINSYDSRYINHYKIY